MSVNRDIRKRTSKFGWKTQWKDVEYTCSPVILIKVEHGMNDSDVLIAVELMNPSFQECS